MVRRYDRLAQAHHDVNRGTVTTTAEQQATVRALIAARPDADLFADLYTEALGLNEPVYQPVPPREYPRHYHRPDMPRATRIGGWV